MLLPLYFREGSQLDKTLGSPQSRYEYRRKQEEENVCRWREIKSCCPAEVITDLD
jgi:hypothetical protein